MGLHHFAYIPQVNNWESDPYRREFDAGIHCGQPSIEAPVFSKVIPGAIQFRTVCSICRIDRWPTHIFCEHRSEMLSCLECYDEYVFNLPDTTRQEIENVTTSSDA
jgi:hypothetical protein